MKKSSPGEPSQALENGTSEARRLERRRDKLRSARAAAESASAQVARLDAELTATTNRIGELDVELAAARDKVAVVKRSIKAVEKQRGNLRAERKQARRGQAAARQKADDAERRYDRAMLADMVRREKQQDLSRHAEPQPALAAGSAESAEPSVLGADGVSTTAPPLPAPAPEVGPAPRRARPARQTTGNGTTARARKATDPNASG
jgi:chromosome segregation ATPase